MKEIKFAKRLFTALSFLALAFVMLFTFSACDLLKQYVFGNGEDIVPPPHEHSYTETVVEPTCAEQGYTLHECADCGDSYKDGYTDKLAHTEISVEAVESTYISAGYTAGVRCEVCGEIISGCELIPVKGYDEFVPRLGNSAYGYYDFLNGEKATEKQRFYIQMYSACENFCKSKEDIEPAEAQFSDGTEVTYYAVDEIDVTDYTLSNDELTLIWKIFYEENPLYYWLANNTMIMTQTSSAHEISKVFVLMADEAYVQYAVRAEYDGDISALTAECANLLSEGMSGADKAKTIHDFLANKIDYAFKADGKTPEDAIWAHNVTGASSKGRGVCETYAKTYMYLCLVNGVNCMIITGTGKTSAGAEEHAWNYIEIDGSWYGVDVTWDDQTKILTKYMGANKSTMDSDHDSKDCYYMQLPELSKTALSFKH